MQTLLKIFLIGLLILSLGYMCAQLAEDSKQEAAQKKAQTQDVTARSEPTCDTAKAKTHLRELVNDFGFEVTAMPSQSNRQWYNVKVQDDWFGLPFEEKESIDRTILCALADGVQSKLPDLYYYDPRTDVLIANSGTSGLTLTQEGTKRIFQSLK